MAKVEYKYICNSIIYVFTVKDELDFASKKDTLVD